ncbi:MAG: YciI family protein [Pseudomonadota bacterium]
MHFAIYCTDKADSQALRQQTRPAHLDFLSAAGERVVLAGPLLDDSAESVIGSLIVLDADDKESAERFAADDPYALAGLFENVTIRHFRKVIPA